MTRRIAACLGLIVFATCLIQGVCAENSFLTVVWRALQGLVVALIVGGVIGVMIEKMLAENLAQTLSQEKSANEGASS